MATVIKQFPSTGALLEYLVENHRITREEILDALGFPLWLTRKEAAEHMRVSERTIDRWADDGLLQEYKVGGLQSTRFKRADLDAMVKPVEPGVPAIPAHPETCQTHVGGRCDCGISQG